MFDTFERTDKRSDVEELRQGLSFRVQLEVLLMLKILVLRFLNPH